MRFTITSEQWMKILKGAGIAGAGAAAIYGVEGVAGLNFGVWQGVAVAAASVLVNIIRQWLIDAMPKKDQA